MAARRRRNKSEETKTFDGPLAPIPHCRELDGYASNAFWLREASDNVCSIPVWAWRTLWPLSGLAMLAVLGAAGLLNPAFALMYLAMALAVLALAYRGFATQWNHRKRFREMGGEPALARAQHYLHLKDCAAGFNVQTAKLYQLTASENAAVQGMDWQPTLDLLAKERVRIMVGFRAHLIAMIHDQHAQDANPQSLVLREGLHRQMKAAFNAAWRLDAGLPPTTDDLELPPMEDLLAKLLESAATQKALPQTGEITE